MRRLIQWIQGLISQNQCLAMRPCYKGQEIPADYCQKKEGHFGKHVTYLGQEF